MNKFFDFYYRFPLLIDLLICAIVWIVNSQFCVFEIAISSETLKSILSSIIDTSVSLAGFILAALTIIVSFKSNLKAKSVNEANSAFELIFSSKHYYGIVSAFKNSIMELTILFFLLYSLWLITDSVDSNVLFKSIVLGVIVLSTSVLRSLALLFSILSLEAKEE